MKFEYHVKPTGSDVACGDAEHPFATISKAAQMASPGDTVIVHEGVYREQVNPRRGGLSEHERITYCGAEGEARPVIKGSECVQGWTELADHPHVWTVVLDNTMFGDFNPFATPIFGDWLEMPKFGKDPDKHLGDVYLNGVSFFESTTLEGVYDPQPRDTDEDFALKIPCPVPDADRTRYVWHAEVDENAGTTTIWANFQGADPNEELVEVSVRRTCFFPSRNHVNYITVRGFEMAQATGDWAPPTSQQWGMIGPNWSYGWIIEDNVLHDAKFSAVSLGKEISSGDNEWAKTERKTGYQYQLEAVFKARRIGWEKGLIGGHIVRNNDIYECGQNAIVGHMGSAFCRIEHNHVHHIALKREFFGWEVAGIKFHAALDTVIANNNIHDCSLGMWMDWQTQGTRITRNVFHDNVRDLMIEVSHGPYLVDNNVFASPVMFQNWSQGGAFVNNLICGGIEPHTVPDRSTPYHYPHTTEVAGCAVVSGGDERWLNNMFAPQPVKPTVGEYGLSAYSDCPMSMHEYLERQRAMWADPSQGGGERNPLQSLYAGGNIYLSGAQGLNKQEGAADDSERMQEDAPFFGGTVSTSVACDEPMPVTLVEEPDGLYLQCTVPQAVADTRMQVVTSDMLGVPRIVEERYEQPDGSDYVLDTDLLGQALTATERKAGALNGLVSGENRIRIWEWNN